MLKFMKNTERVACYEELQGKGFISLKEEHGNVTCKVSSEQNARLLHQYSLHKTIVGVSGYVWRKSNTAYQCKHLMPTVKRNCGGMPMSPKNHLVPHGLRCIPKGGYLSDSMTS